jgi:protein-S-isoprenylcysteine O-methyltransferase Ste14
VAVLRQHTLRRREQLEDVGRGDAVEGLPPVGPRGDEAALLEAGQVPGDVGLRAADLRHEVRDAPLPLREAEQDGQAGRVGEAAEEPGADGGRLAGIHRHEPIISAVTDSSSAPERTPMAWLALGLYLLYLALAFGLRGWLQWRRTGDAGFRFGNFSASPAERAGALLLVLALALALAAPVLELLGVLSLLEALRAPIAGTLLALAGVGGTLHAQLAMGASWRVGVDPSERTALRTDGPFRLVRNPIYTWMILAAAGLALLVPNAASLASALVLVVGLELQVRLVEEPYLARLHGESYARWASRTGRFVPGVGLRRR